MTAFGTGTLDSKLHPSASLTHPPLYQSGRRFPVTLTLLHMIACIIITRAVPYVTGRNVKNAKGQHAKIVLLACLFTLSVALGNMSLQHIPVSTNQIVSSTTPIFTALLSMACLGRYQSNEQFASLLPIVAGVVVSCRSSVSSRGAMSDGILLCFLSTLLRALKSVVQESILDGGRSMDSLSLLYHMAPLSACLLIILVPFEASWDAIVSGSRQSPTLVYGLALNALLAVVVNLCNLLVTQFSSAVTLQVHGNAKVALASLISFVFMERSADATTLTGAGITLTGLVLYSRGHSRRRD